MTRQRVNRRQVLAAGCFAPLAAAVPGSVAAGPAPDDTWVFAYVGDMQPGSPRSFRFNPRLVENWRVCREQILALEPELLLVGGDLTRDGSIHRWELEEMKDDLALPFPVHVVAGNMDTGNKHTDRSGRFRGPSQKQDRDLNVTSAQLRQFADAFGPLWWTFSHKGVRFSGCTDLVINSGLPEEERFWSWAEELAREPTPAQHVWITHCPPFVDRPDEPNWDIATHYLQWYFSIDQPARGRLLELFHKANVSICISGHVHSYRSVEFDGIRYVLAPAPSFAQRLPGHQTDMTLGFLRFDVTGEEIRETIIPLERVSAAEGAWGPGGHPRPELRDYSLAQEHRPNGQ